MTEKPVAAWAYLEHRKRKRNACAVFEDSLLDIERQDAAQWAALFTDHLDVDREKMLRDLMPRRIKVLKERQPHAVDVQFKLPDTSMLPLSTPSAATQQALSVYVPTGATASTNHYVTASDAVTISFQWDALTNQLTQLAANNVSARIVERVTRCDKCDDPRHYRERVLNDPEVLAIINGYATAPMGRALNINLPDGSVLALDSQGNFRIDDSQAKVVYQANRNRTFNPYLNASDMLRAFLEYARDKAGVRPEVLGQLPVILFINWLVLEAARVDRDPVPDGIVPPERHQLLVERVRPRCLDCKRFVPRALADKGFSFCNPAHAARHHARLVAA